MNKAESLKKWRKYVESFNTDWISRDQANPFVKELDRWLVENHIPVKCATTTRMAFEPSDIFLYKFNIVITGHVQIKLDGLYEEILRDNDSKIYVEKISTNTKDYTKTIECVIVIL